MASHDKFWGSQPSALPPLTDEVVRDAEQALGVSLPAAYLELLRAKNGGSTSGLALPTATPTSWAGDHVPFENMEGIASSWEFGSPSSIMKTAYMTEEWGLPAKQVLLEGGGHWWITLDYRKSDVPCVSWIDVEMDQDIQLAPTFEEFVRALVPADEFAVEVEDTPGFVWKPERIQASVESPIHLRPKQTLRLDQAVPKGESGWSMLRISLPNSWRILALEFTGENLYLGVSGGRMFALNGGNIDVLRTAIMAEGQNPSDEALARIWAQHELHV